jgi:hypothetical protein
MAVVKTVVQDRVCPTFLISFQLLLSSGSILLYFSQTNVLYDVLQIRV